MSTCLKHSTVVGCWNKADNTKENVVIHYTYATNAGGVEILKAIRYTISDGTPIALGVGDTVTPGACVADLVECVVGSANLVTEALDVNLGAMKEVISPGSTLTTFHTLLGNNLDIQGDGLTNLMGAGINANISGSTYIGAQFTYTFNLIADSDPGDPADFGITVWDNVAGTSVTATSITSTATYVGDAQGSGLNVPFYAWGAPGTYTIVWTGDLPVGDYTIGYMNQNFSPADHVELQVTHNLVDSMTTSKAQLVALDQCTIDALTPVPSVETDLIKTNWLPLCVDGVQWYVSEKSTFDNSTSIESSVTKIYKQGANGSISTSTPVGTIVEGYCQILTTAENGSQNRITAALALNSVTVANPTFTGARDVTVYNSKNVTVAFEYTTTINGIMHRQNIPANGTWSNTLKRDAYTNEGTYVNGQIVAAYGAATAAGEININWTT